MSYADVQSRITKTSLPPTNEGDQTKIPKLVNLLQSRLRPSERMRKSQDTKEAEVSHTKKRNAFTSKRLLDLYTVLSTVFNKYTSRVLDTKPGDTTYDELINRFHEANGLYDGTHSIELISVCNIFQ